MKNKLLQLINSLTQKLRERITSSQDSPVSSCCPTLRQRIRQSLCITPSKVSHRFTTTRINKIKKIGTIQRKNKKNDTKSLKDLKPSRLKSISMITLERKVAEVGKYLRKLEKDFSPKISSNRHLSIKFELIIDDQDKNSNQKAVLLSEIIDKLSNCLEKNWEDFPEEAYQLFEEIILKINELEDKNEPDIITETEFETQKYILILSQSLERLKAVLEDIVQCVKINKFVKDERNTINNPLIDEKAKEIIKKAKSSEKNPQILKKWLSTYLKSGYDQKS